MKYEITKGSEKDFEGAPEGCTKVLVCVGEIHYVIGDKTSEGIAVQPSDEDNYLIAERRPITEPVWDGEGVPCVGQKVMTKSGEGIIDYVGSAVIVYSNNDGQWSVRCDSLDYSLSAIRSPEDVARDEFGAVVAGYLDVRPNGVRMSELYDAIAAGKIPGIILDTKSVKQSDRECEHKNTHPASGGCICNDCGWTSW